MSIIENKLWSGERIRAIIHFDGASDYIVETAGQQNSTELNNFIHKASFSLTEGNNKVNPLGIAVSNSLTLQIYDTNDYLSPSNQQSPYFGKTVNGVQIDMFITYDNLNWEAYGTFYVTSWTGSYSDGTHNLTTITAEDKLNTLGSLDLPDIPVYANILVDEMIHNVLNALNISDSEYTIDPSLDQTLLYGIANGSKVRDFLNNICQLLFARVIIDRNNIIRFIPALSVSSLSSNSIELTGEYTGALSNKTNHNIDYNQVKVKYLEAGEIQRKIIFTDTSHTLQVGTNNINDITFNSKALSVEQIKLTFNQSENTVTTETGLLVPYVDKIHYIAYQQGISLNINVLNTPIKNANIQGIGLVTSTTQKEAIEQITNSSIIGGSTFEFDTKQMLTQTEAKSLASSLASYLQLISRNIQMSSTALTPKLYIGDQLSINNTNTLYDGTYKIIQQNIEFGENYNHNLALIKIS